MNKFNMIDDAEFINVEFLEDDEQVVNFVDEDSSDNSIDIEIINIEEL